MAPQSPNPDYHTKPSPYMEGAFAPTQAELTLENLEVIGELPTELEGMFVRNSPNPRYRPRGRYHWFDGDGMLHGIHIRDGKADYRNRFVRTNHFETETAANTAVWSGILEPIDFENPQGPDKNTANTDLIWHDGRLLATWWLGGDPYVISVPDLATQGVHDYKGKLGGQSGGMSAHPKVDEKTGEMMFIDYSLYSEPYLHYGVVSAHGELERFEPIDIPGPRLQHDLAITENYTVLMDLPMLWDPDKIRAGKRKVEFDRDMPARFGILPRHGGNNDIRWFETPACYIFHTINAHEEGDEIVLRACRIEDPLPRTRKDLNDPTVPRLFFLKLVPYLHEWRFNLKTGAVRERRLDDRPTEFPRINSATTAYENRFSYNSRLARSSEMLFDAVVKYDLRTNAAETHEFGPGRFGSEPVFAQRMGAGTAPEDEDDGWATSLVQDTNTGGSELVVMNARDMSGPPQARVIIPARVPIGFHAWWIRGDQLAHAGGRPA